MRSTAPGKTTDKEHEIVERLMAGQTHEQIALWVGCDPSAISYFKRRRNIIVPKRRTQQDDLCAQAGCKRNAASRGYCISHYNEHLKRGEFASLRGQRHKKPILLPLPQENCDHSSSRCDCVNQGKPSYNEYLREAGMNAPQPI